MQNDRWFVHIIMCGAGKIKPQSEKLFLRVMTTFRNRSCGVFFVFRQVFPMLWKTYKLFCRFLNFRQVSHGGMPGDSGKPGGKCGQPGPFSHRGGCYFGELCNPKSTPCGGPERMSNCYFSVKLPKQGKNLPGFFSVCTGYFRSCLL